MNFSKISILTWLRRGGAAIADQLIYSGTNYIVVLTLARSLNSLDYGAFSTANSLFLLLSTFHTSLIIEPMMVFGSGKFRDQFYSYQKKILNYNVAFGIISFFLLGAMSAYLVFSGNKQIGMSLLGLSVSTPLVLFLWLVRRSAYVILEPKASLYGSVCYSFAYAIGVYLFSYFKFLSSFSAFLLMGISSVISGILILMVVQRKIRDISNVDIESRDVNIIKSHIYYGKWALISSLLSWIPVDAHFVVLPFFFSTFGDVANLRAVYNGILPILSVNTAIAPMFIPVFVRAKERGNLKSSFTVAFFVLISFSFLYYVFLIIMGINIFSSFYQSKYDLQLLRLLGLYPVLASGVTTLAALMRSLEMPKVVALASIGAVVFTLTIGFFWVTEYGYTGSVYSILGSSLTYLVLLIILCIKNIKG